MKTVYTVDVLNHNGKGKGFYTREKRRDVMDDVKYALEDPMTGTIIVSVNVVPEQPDAERSDEWALDEALRRNRRYAGKED